MAGVMRREVRDEGVCGVLFRPEAPGQHPGLVVLGGSRGGIRVELAAFLAEQGLACLALVYFGGPGHPEDLAEVPLELVDRAARWLADQPVVTGLPVGAVGGSKGAELALLAASSFPGTFGPVVAIAPASVAFFGLGGDPATWRRSSWSLEGRPVPFVPYPTGVEPHETGSGLAVAPIYEAALADYDAVQEAPIPVECIRGPLLLVSGGDDRMWPSTRMAEEIVDRMDRHGRGDEVTHISYPEAGHNLLGAAEPGPEGRPPGRTVRFDLGGTERADAEARRDAWERAAGFLRTHLLAADREHG